MTDTDDEITRIGPGAYFDAAFSKGQDIASGTAPERRGGLSVDTLASMYAYALPVVSIPLFYVQDWPPSEWRRRAINDFGTGAL